MRAAGGEPGEFRLRLAFDTGAGSESLPADDAISVGFRCDDSASNRSPAFVTAAAKAWGLDNGRSAPDCTAATIAGSAAWAGAGMNSLEKQASSPADVL